MEEKIKQYRKTHPKEFCKDCDEQLITKEETDKGKCHRCLEDNGNFEDY